MESIAIRRVFRGMNTITRAIKRLFASEQPARRPVSACLIEAVEGRVLMSATLNGTSAPAPVATDATPATIVARKAGGGQQEYLTIILSDVLVSSYR